MRRTLSNGREEEWCYACCAWEDIQAHAPRSLPPPTKEQVARLADAMWQLLDDMGDRGVSVCLAAKASARIAYEPFLDPDAPPAMTLAEAQRIATEANR